MANQETAEKIVPDDTREYWGISIKKSNGDNDYNVPFATKAQHVYLNDGHTLQDMSDNYNAFTAGVNMIAYSSKEPQNRNRFPLWVDTATPS